MFASVGVRDPCLGLRVDSRGLLLGCFEDPVGFGVGVGQEFLRLFAAFADSPVGFLVDPLFAPRGLFDLFVRFFLRFGGQGPGFGPRLAEDGPGFRFGLVEDGLAFGLGAVDHVLHVDADVLVGVRRLVFELLVLLPEHGQTLVELPFLGLPRVVLAFEPDDLGLVERAA